MSGVLEKQTHPDLETWRNLLSKSMAAIEVVERSTGTEQQIRLGGGTVLSALWGHRFSKDVDLFTRDPQILGFLRPWLNDELGAILGTNYEEGTNAIKFRLEGGSIDVVVATSSRIACQPLRFIAVEKSKSKTQQRYWQRNFIIAATVERCAIM